MTPPSSAASSAASSISNPFSSGTLGNVSTIPVANAPCSWGALEFDLEDHTDGRSQAAKASYQQVLDEIVETGYIGTELGDWGFMPTDPDVLKEEINSRKLTLLGAFVPVRLVDADKHEAGIEMAVKTAALLAAVNPNAFIVLSDDNASVDVRREKTGRITADMSLNKEQWETFAEGADLLAKTVFAETGLKTVFHHHGAGFVETPDEVDELLSRTNPEFLGLCLDTGHYSLGGGDPMDVLKKHQDRVWHVHFKDFDPAVLEKAEKKNWDYFDLVREGVFCELGKGSVDFKSIKDRLLETSYRGWIVVEQDILPGMGTPKESAKRNREYLESVGL